MECITFYKSLLSRCSLCTGQLLLNYKSKSILSVGKRFKSWKRYLDFSKVPKLDESELEQQNVRGWGPGGQSVNKTNNAVVLKHKPTNIVIKCHETRSLMENQKRARELLTSKLDNLMNGEDSIESQERRLNLKKLLEKKRRQKILTEKKKALKERENVT